MSNSVNRLSLFTSLCIWLSLKICDNGFVRLSVTIQKLEMLYKGDKSASAKCFDSFQPAQSAQVEMDRNLFLLVKPFPNKPRFLRVCSTGPLKTFLEKEKLLVTSNFSFSQNVF